MLPEIYVDETGPLVPGFPDSLKWYPRVTVTKYNPDTVAGLVARLGYEPAGDELLRFAPDDVVHAEANQCVTAGLSLICNLIIGAGGNAFTSSSGIIGVGSSTTAFSVSQTALGGDGSTSSAYYQAVSSAPTQSAGTISAQTTFPSGVANFVWNEWCAATAGGTITAGGTLASVGTTATMLNRKVVSLGTKASGAAWVLSLSISLS